MWSGSPSMVDAILYETAIAAEDHMVEPASDLSPAGQWYELPSIHAGCIIVSVAPWVRGVRIRGTPPRSSALS